MKHLTPVYAFVVSLLFSTTCMAQTGSQSASAASARKEIVVSEGSIVMIGSPLGEVPKKGKLLSEQGDEIPLRRFNDSIATSKYLARWERSSGGEIYRLVKKEKTPFNYIGKTLPVTSLKTFDGEDVSFQKKKNKLTYINFWTTTCKPCIDEFKLIDSLRRQNPKVEFLGIAYEDNEVVSQFAKKGPFPFKPVLDGKQANDMFEVDSYPMHIIIDLNNTIRYVVAGLLDDKKLPELIRQLRM
ncbi:TlpA family protein disulfide reductase [Pedobacter faecalis]|uniref:TlpA family protein disulfide reductase n=1 Tax=Pedobacter faecalis TaxID=3041495 RepID=UPI002550A4F6|nr:TlpA disulfide reductase family protein [Pedobacter sp. ELA7]